MGTVMAFFGRSRLDDQTVLSEVPEGSAGSPSIGLSSWVGSPRDGSSLTPMSPIGERGHEVGP